MTPTDSERFVPHPLVYCLFTVTRNKQGQTRYSSYYEWISMDERTALESEIIRKCLSRSELQCSFLEYRGFKVIYRRYASLFFIVGTKPDVGTGEENTENELGMLEFIHTLVETMDKWAGSICEVRDFLVEEEERFGLLQVFVLTLSQCSVGSLTLCISSKTCTSWWTKWSKTDTSLRRTRLIFFGPLLSWSAKVRRRKACSDRLAEFKIQYF
jgi:AP-4 complex subunit sigma-1